MKRRAILRLILIVVALAVLWPDAAASAADSSRQTSGPITLDVRIGFDGYVQSGAWTPVFVTASNSGDDVSAGIRIEVAPLAGGRTTYTRPIDLPRGSRKQVTLYVSDLATFGNQVQVDLVERGRVIASVQAPIQSIPPTTLLIGAWSDTPQGLVALAAVRPTSNETRVALLTADDLPALAAGWGALDVLVIADTDTGQLTPDQQTALYDWVVSGGRLIIAAGPSYRRTLAGLDRLTPLLATGTQAVSLEPLWHVARVPFTAQAVLDAPVSTGDLIPGAQVLVASEGVPLLVWRNIGHGRVDLLTADPGLEPLLSWDGMGNLWRAVLANGLPRPGWAYGFNTGWDYARQAVADVPGVSLPSVLQLCGFLTLYVLLIGPINYLILSRLRRRELAWFTIPILILIFAVMAYLTGFQLRGTRVIMHRLALVQTFSESDTARVDALIGLWSPRRARYDLLIDRGYLARPLPQGLSGALTSTGNTQVEQSETVRLRNVQVDVGSVQGFVVEGLIHSAPRITGDLTLALDGNLLHITGEIVNASDVNLSGASLMIVGTLTPLGDLPAGSVRQVDQVLAGNRATLSPGSALDPFPTNAPYYGYVYYGAGYDQFVSQIAGGDCYLAATDIRRRCNLTYSLQTGQGTGSGAYLIGWGDRIPLGTQVLNATSETIDLALYIAGLNITFAAPAGEMVELPPALMTWRSLNPDLYTYTYTTPYDLYIYSGEEYSFRFEPAVLARMTDVEGLVIHLGLPADMQQQSTLPFLVQIHNFENGQWDRLPIGWGDSTIRPVDRYVDSTGGVEVRLEVNPDAQNIAVYGLTIPRFDVTLIGQYGPGE